MHDSEQDGATDGGQRAGMLARALTLLDAVATHADGVGRGAARQTGIDRSAVSRILA